LSLKVDPNKRQQEIKKRGQIGRPSTSEQIKDKIVMRYNEGVELKKIAQELDVSLSTVCKVIRERKN